jgi:hypothetical protein
LRLKEAHQRATIALRDGPHQEEDRRCEPTSGIDASCVPNELTQVASPQTDLRFASLVLALGHE